MSDNSKGKQIEIEDSRRAENMKKWKNVMESTDLQDVLNTLGAVLSEKLISGGFTLQLRARPHHNVASTPASHDRVATYSWHNDFKHTVISHNGNDNTVEGQADRAALENVTGSELHHTDDQESSPSVLKALKISVPPGVKTWKELEAWVIANNGKMFPKNLDLSRRLGELRLEHELGRAPDPVHFIQDTGSSRDSMPINPPRPDNTGGTSVEGPLDRGDPSGQGFDDNGGWTRVGWRHGGRDRGALTQSHTPFGPPPPIPPITAPAYHHPLQGRGQGRGRRGRGYQRARITAAVRDDPYALASLERSGLSAPVEQHRQLRPSHGPSSSRSAATSSTLAATAENNSSPTYRHFRPQPVSMALATSTPSITRLPTPDVTINPLDTWNHHEEPVIQGVFESEEEQRKKYQEDLAETLAEQAGTLW